MQMDTRAAKARGLAQWFRATADEDGARSALMALVADLLEREADDAPQDVVPDIAPAVFVTRPTGRPRAANDNVRLMRRRTK